MQLCHWAVGMKFSGNQHGHNDPSGQERVDVDSSNDLISSQSWGPGPQECLNYQYKHISPLNGSVIAVIYWSTIKLAELACQNFKRSETGESHLTFCGHH